MNYVEAFGGLFNGNDSFKLEWEGQTPIKTSICLSFLHAAFSVSKVINKSGEIELRSGRPCINTNSYPESKLLYEMVCGSPFFRKLTQLAALTNLTKGQYKDVLNDIEQAEQMNQESKFSFLFLSCLVFI